MKTFIVTVVLLLTIGNNSYSDTVPVPITGKFWSEMCSGDYVGYIRRAYISYCADELNKFLVGVEETIKQLGLGINPKRCDPTNSPHQAALVNDFVRYIWHDSERAKQEFPELAWGFWMECADDL